MNATLTGSSLKNVVGLADGQRRVGLVSCSTKGSNWYNEQGEWLGWGDLTRTEMDSIAKELRGNQRFIVLHEWDSFRRFLKDIVPDPSRVLRTEDSVELAYVAEHALFIIEPGSISRIEDVQPIRETETRDGVSFQFIRSSTAKARILCKTESSVH